MDHSYFCMGLPLLIVPAGGQDAAAHSLALGVSPGKSCEAGAGTLCHRSPRMRVTFPTRVRWRGRGGRLFLGLKGMFSSCLERLLAQLITVVIQMTCPCLEMVTSRAVC